jgi:modification methylase
MTRNDRKGQKPEPPYKGRIGLKKTRHQIIVGDSGSLEEIGDKTVHLVVTSPPYYNSPHHMNNLFNGYSSEFLPLMEKVAKELYRVLDDGRIACIVCDDMLVRERKVGPSEKMPVVADITKIFTNSGFWYRDEIMWLKPTGYGTRQRRAGAFIQSSLPMNLYFENITESILIFQKKFFHKEQISKEVMEESSLAYLVKNQNSEFWKDKWYQNIWRITNVMPNKKEEAEKHIPTFPGEIPYRLIMLYSYVGETVLDPFLGTGTTMQVAIDLGRSSIGYEIRKGLLPFIQRKVKTPFLKKHRQEDQKALTTESETSYRRPEYEMLEPVIREEVGQSCLKTNLTRMS